VENLSDLSLFCLVLVKECGSPDTLSEEEKAEEFRKGLTWSPLAPVKCLEICVAIMR